MGTGGIKNMEVKLKDKVVRLNADKWVNVKGMQFFADGGEGGSDSGSADGGEGGKEEGISFESQAELDSFVDKRVDKALKTARSNWKSEFSTKLEEEKKEAERLAKLSQKERENEELTKREKALNDRLKELERRELKADTIKVLNENKLPADFAEFLMGEDDKTTFENIKNFKDSFDKAIEEAVNTRLKGNTPKSTGSQVQTKESTNFAELAQKNRLVGK